MSFTHSPQGLGQRALAKSPEVRVACPLLLLQPCYSGQFWGDPWPLPHPWAHMGRLSSS